MNSSRRHLVIGFSVVSLLVLAGPAQGQFAAGHIFVYDNIWQDADVLEYDASGQFVGRPLQIGGGETFTFHGGPSFTPTPSGTGGSI